VRATSRIRSATTTKVSPVVPTNRVRIVGVGVVVDPEFRIRPRGSG
jgi:hypothetical protein